MTWDAFLVWPGYVALLAAITLVLAAWAALMFAVVEAIERRVRASARPRGPRPAPAPTGKRTGRWWWEP